MDRREKMLQGTRNSHIARKLNANPAVGIQQATHIGSHDGSTVASELKRTETNRTELGKEGEVSKPVKSNGGLVNDPFVRGYVAEEAKERTLDD